jgi:hypothetical protein
MMMKLVSKPIIGRRQFLSILGASTSTAAATQLPMAALADSESGDEKRRSRYRESDHIKTFYRVNRYPS